MLRNVEVRNPPRGRALYTLHFTKSYEVFYVQLTHLHTYLVHTGIQYLQVVIASYLAVIMWQGGAEGLYSCSYVIIHSLLCVPSENESYHAHKKGSYCCRI